MRPKDRWNIFAINLKNSKLISFSLTFAYYIKENLPKWIRFSYLTAITFKIINIKYLYTLCTTIKPSLIGSNPWLLNVFKNNKTRIT